MFIQFSNKGPSPRGDNHLSNMKLDRIFVLRIFLSELLLPHITCMGHI